jgi:type IV pilus assembly protein PilA
MEEQPLEKAPDPKPQKSVKKTALFAKLSIWVFLGAIAYLILGFNRLMDSKNTEVYILGPFAIASICSIIGYLQILFSKSKLTGKVYCLPAPMLSIFLLIAVPNFLRFGARAYQSEAKANLSAIFIAYNAYHSDYHTYPSSPLIQVGNTVYNCLAISEWEPKGTVRYNYNCMNTEAFSPATNDSPCPPGIVSTATKDSFTIAACGNVDNDATVDVWTINDAKKLRNVVDDVKR